MSPERPPGPLRLSRVLIWLAAVAGLLVLADLAERLFLYQVLEQDRTRTWGAVRRPLKDTALALVQRLPTARGGTELAVFDFYLKPDDQAELERQVARLQVLGGNAQQVARWLPARMRVEGQSSILDHTD